MKFVSSLRNVSLGLAAAALACGVALAQNNSDAASQPDQSFNLVGVNARLDHAIDSRTAKAGESVMARLDGTVKTDSGVKLERGTQLVGTVTSVQPAANDGASTLTLAFTTAQLKDGKQIPVKVTLIGAYPASSGEEATYATDDIPPAPQHIDNQEKIDQEAGMLSRVALQSSVQASNSGTFLKRDGNFKLDAGTFFQVGIAPINGNATSTGE